jgi:hypothetical protein
MVVFKNPRVKTEVVHFARQVYPENITSFHNIYLDFCRDTHTYLFLDLTQSGDDLLRFRIKIFPDEVTELFAPIKSNEGIEITTTLSSSS